MTGSIINAAGILLGGILALVFRKNISPGFQNSLKSILGVLTVFFGLKLVWNSLNGSFLQVLKLLGIVLLSMTLGKLLGRALRFQRASNAVGRYATQKMANLSASRDRFNEGFMVCAALFCVAPLAVLAPLQEGLTGWSWVFIVKAVMDAAATVSFALMFGWGAVLAAIPVLAFQSVIARLASAGAPWLNSHPGPLVDAICATDGMLIFCVGLIILQLKKIEVTDYLPSLAVAPLMTRWLW
jgi:uncharacterized protein